MNKEKTKKTSEDSIGSKPADMDSICEEISKSIVEGLVEKEFIEDPESFSKGNSVIAETAVIDPFGNQLLGKDNQSVSAVESLIDSAEISNKIVRIVQEKVEQVLDDDFTHNRNGDSGIIAERVHLECARLFGRESFRNDIICLLRQDIQRYIVPDLRQDLLQYVRRILMEITNLLVNKIAKSLEFVKKSQTVRKESFCEKDSEKTKEVKIVEEPELMEETGKAIPGEYQNGTEEMEYTQPIVKKECQKTNPIQRKVQTKRILKDEAEDPYERIRENLYSRGLL